MIHRKRAARHSAKLSTIERKIREVFNLPEGAVRLVRPDGRKMRGNTTIRTLRKAWDA